MPRFTSDDKFRRIGYQGRAFVRYRQSSLLYPLAPIGGIERGPFLEGQMLPHLRPPGQRRWFALCLDNARFDVPVIVQRSRLALLRNPASP